MDDELSDLLSHGYVEHVELRDAHLKLELRFLRGFETAPLDDLLVELRLDGVHAVVATYESYDLSVRPSELEVERPLEPADLRDWRVEPYESEGLALEGTGDVEAARADWLVGDETRYRESPSRLALGFEGQRRASLTLLVGFAGLESYSGGAPLARATWRAEKEAHKQLAFLELERYEHEHDRSADDSAEAQDLGEELVRELETPYPFPDEPMFELHATDVPAVLLAPLRAHYESQGDGLERHYGRVIEDWWIEGSRAYVGVRTHSHRKPLPLSGLDGGFSEGVQDFSLQRRGDIWVIRHMSAMIR